MTHFLGGKGNPRSFGKFAISMEAINSFTEVFMNDLFSRRVILRAEYDETMDAMLYMAWSGSFFRPTKEGEIPPSYNIIIDQGEIIAKEIK